MTIFALYIRFIISICILIFSSVATYATDDVPVLSGRVNDYANLMSQRVARDLENTLAQFEKQTSTQIAVLTITTLKGENIDSYSLRVANTWKLGHKVKNNGVLIVIAQSERKIRIEVGPGLQKHLTNDYAKKIITKVMRPYLKEEDYDRALTAGCYAVISETREAFSND